LCERERAQILNSDTQRYFELLDRRMALLDMLATTLREARRDVVGLDVDGLEAHITQQEQLCRQVSALDDDLNGLQKRWLALAPPVSGDCGTANEKRSVEIRLAEIRERMRAAQARVKGLNDAHQALLRRCRRTAGALSNMYARFAATYSEPVHVRISAEGRA
jgi:uncharacterized protein YukE